MSERIDLRSGEEIRDWARENEFDIVDLESEDTPRFFQRKFTPQLLISVKLATCHAAKWPRARSKMAGWSE